MFCPFLSRLRCCFGMRPAGYETGMICSKDRPISDASSALASLFARLRFLVLSQKSEIQFFNITRRRTPDNYSDLSFRAKPTWCQVRPAPAPRHPPWSPATASDSFSLRMSSSSQTKDLPKKQFPSERFSAQVPQQKVQGDNLQCRHSQAKVRK